METKTQHFIWGLGQKAEGIQMKNAARKIQCARKITQWYRRRKKKGAPRNETEAGEQDERGAAAEEGEKYTKPTYMV